MSTIDLEMVGPSSRVAQDDPQATLNFYAEKTGDRWTLKPTPGAVYQYSLGVNGGGRQAISLGGRLFGVRGAFFQEIINGVSVVRGTLSSSSGPVAMIGALPPDGSGQILIVDDDHGYVFEFDGNAFTTLTESDNGFVGGLGQAAFCGGYGVVIKPGTNQVGYSALYNFLDWPGTSFFSTESTKGNLVALASTGSNLHLFTENGFEVWTTEGYEPPLAFTPIVRNFQIGCQAPQSLVAFNRYVYWLGGNDAGKGVVYRYTSGGIPQRISDHAIERQIAGFSEQADAVGFCYQSLGHVFYIMTFVASNKTLCYDSDTEYWHSRAWRYPILGTLYAMPYQAMLIHDGTLLGLDRRNGDFFEVSNTTYTDNGAPIRRERILPVVPEEGDKMTVVSALELFAETGNTPLQTVEAPFLSSSPSPMTQTVVFMANMNAAVAALNSLGDYEIGACPNPATDVANFETFMEEFLEGVEDAGGSGFSTTETYPILAVPFVENLDIALTALEGLWIEANSVQTQIMLQYSTDRGMTWGQEIWQQSGGDYSYSSRTRWTGLGSGFGFTFKFAIVANQFVSWRRARMTAV